MLISGGLSLFPSSWKLETVGFHCDKYFTVSYSAELSDALPSQRSDPVFYSFFLLAESESNSATPLTN